MFQFTHPGGVRLPLQSFQASCLSVSIHAPGRGATQELYEDLSKLKVSIHAPGRGATPRETTVAYKARSFNSRTREGCDDQVHKPARTLSGFNSRTREGCDLRRSLLLKETSVSIHAPGRGATPCLVRELNPGEFQFTHPGGVRRTLIVTCATVITVSIHAPGRGATNSVRVLSHEHIRFNSRTREGCDDCAKFSVPKSSVSIHAPGRGATVPNLRKS